MLACWGVSRRKIVKPGKVWATDRRTTRRYFLFRPDESGRIAQAFWYCLAYCAGKYAMEVHAALLMSTHPHLVCSDPEAQQPRFKMEFHRLLALCVKAILGWPEEVFNKSKGGEHEPVTPRAMVKAIAYLIANPTMAFAVRYSRDWPGPKTRPEDVGNLVVRVKRPDAYFAKDNPQWPDELTLKLTMPAMLEDAYGVEGARARIAEEVKRLEREALEESRKRGVAFRGVRRVLRTPYTARARSYEAFGTLNPRFSAAGDPEAAARCVRELRQFDRDYEPALAKLAAGDRKALFPFGTWWLRVHLGVRCKPPP